MPDNGNGPTTVPREEPAELELEAPVPKSREFFEEAHASPAGRAIMEQLTVAVRPGRRERLHSPGQQVSQAASAWKRSVVDGVARWRYSDRVRTTNRRGRIWNCSTT